MKPKNLIKAAITVFILTLALLPQVSEAQISIPYTIMNNLPCSVKVSWTLIDSGGSPCNSSSSAIGISSGGAITINPSDFTPCGGSASNVKIDVVNIAGTPTSDQADSAVPTPSLTSVPPCTGSTSKMNWTTSQCDLNP